MPRLTELLCLVAVCIALSGAEQIQLGLTYRDTMNLLQKNSDNSAISGPSTRVAPCYSVAVTNYAYQVSVISGIFLCVGSIISPLWVLTTAMCAVIGSGKTMQVRSGSQYWNSGGVVTNITSRVIHPTFSLSYFEADVALLKVQTAFVLSTTVKKISLPSQGQTIPAGSITSHTGWGARCNGPFANDTALDLQMIIMQTWPQSNCEAYWTSHLPPSFKASSSVCASAAGNATDCLNPEGGPMVYNNQLFGLNSWSACSYPSAPGEPVFFTSVAMYRTWITSTSGV